MKKNEKHQHTRADDRNDPPHTVTKGVPAPKFGFAGSGGAEYEQIRKDDIERQRGHEHHEHHERHGHDAADHKDTSSKR